MDSVVVWLLVGFELWSTTAGDQRKGEEETLDIYTLTSSPLRSSKAGYPFLLKAKISVTKPSLCIWFFFGGGEGRVVQGTYSSYHTVSLKMVTDALGPTLEY